MASIENNSKALSLLLKTRWILLGIFLLMLIVIEIYPFNFNLEIMWQIWLVSFLLNVIFEYSSHLKRYNGMLLIAMMGLDTALVGVVVIVTGGPQSPYLPLYFFIVITASMLLTQLLTAILTAWACINVMLSFWIYHRFGNFFILEPVMKMPSNAFFIHETIRMIFYIILMVFISGRMIQLIFKREEHLRQQERLLDQKKRLIQLGELSAQIAHGINTPLGLVSGHLEFALGKVSKKTSVHRELLKIEKYLQRVVETVQSILNVNRQTRDAMYSVHLGEVIRKACSLLHSKIKKKGAHVILEIPAELPRIQVYPDELLQVITNVIENAVDALMAERESMILIRAQFQPRSMRLSNQDHRGEVRLSIQDTGQGIPASDLKRIFEPFYSTKEHRGNGMGLFIVKRIMEACQGHIEIQSQLGKGTTLTLSFCVDDSEKNLQVQSNQTDQNMQGGSIRETQPIKMAREKTFRSYFGDR